MTIDLEALYVALHEHPELSFQEHKTAARMAELLEQLGYEVTTGVGQTGVVGVLRNGEGPTVWMRADMDALPVKEETGLPYASQATGTDPSGNAVPVMHACGHDMHMTAMIGAAQHLAEHTSTWSGTAVIIMQPAEELGMGAQRMLEDGFLDRFPRPDVVLAQHLTPLPSGVINMTVGPQTSGCDTVTIKLWGRGGHGSRPHTTVDAVVLAAAVVMRLQTITSRLIDPREVAVVTVGSMHAGLKENIIASEATLEVSIRYANDAIREQILRHMERIVRAEALASGADREPELIVRETLPPTINDEAETPRVIEAFKDTFGEENVLDLGMSPGSEDVSLFAREAGVPMVFWYWGGWDPVAYREAERSGSVERDIPTNHSPLMAPVIHPTIDTGVKTLVTAARVFLGGNEPVNES